MSKPCDNSTSSSNTTTTAEPVDLSPIGDDSLSSEKRRESGFNDDNPNGPQHNTTNANVVYYKVTDDLDVCDCPADANHKTDTTDEVVRETMSSNTDTDAEMTSLEVDELVDHSPTGGDSVLAVKRKRGEDHNDGPYGPQYKKTDDNVVFYKLADDLDVCDCPVSAAPNTIDEVDKEKIIKMDNIIYETLYSSVSPIGARYEICIKRFLDDRNRFPVIVIRRQFFVNKKKEFTIYLSEFDKICELIHHTLNEPYKPFDYILPLNGSRRRCDTNFIKLDTIACNTQVTDESNGVEGSSLTYNMFDIRYYFRKSTKDNDWQPTQAGVRLYLSELRQMLSFRSRVQNRVSEIQKLNMYINNVGSVLAPKFDRYMQKLKCDDSLKDYKKCSQVLNINGFIKGMTLSDFTTILNDVIVENAPLYMCLQHYEPSDLFHYLRSDEGVNDMIKCILPQF